MNTAEPLPEPGQILWPDNITCDLHLLATGAVRRSLIDFAVTGLTLNPAIFDHAIRHSDFHDDALRAGTLLAFGNSRSGLMAVIASGSVSS